MTDQETKAEAEKIIQEFYTEILEYPAEIYPDDIELQIAKKCATIDVKHTIEQIERMYPHVHYGSELKKFQSILTQLENR